MLCSGVLCSIEWPSFTNISGQHVGPIFKGQGYAALSGNPLPTFWDNVSVPSFGIKKSMDGTDTLS
jgi:hypothetical protein